MKFRTGKQPFVSRICRVGGMSAVGSGMLPGVALPADARRCRGRLPDPHALLLRQIQGVRLRDPKRAGKFIHIFHHRIAAKLAR